MLTPRHSISKIHDIFVFLQNRNNGCDRLNADSGCTDDVASIGFANIIERFDRRFQIVGTLDSKSLFKALALIFISLLRSEYKIDIDFISYEISTGLVNTEKGSGEKCTLLYVTSEIRVTNYYDIDELLLIVDWLNSMSLKIRDVNANGNVLKLFAPLNASFCRLNSTEKRIIHIDFLLDPGTWQTSTSFTRFIKNSSHTSDPPCLEMEFLSSPQRIYSNCVKFLKKSARFLPPVDDLAEIVLTYTCFGFSCTCLLVAIPVHACTHSWGTVPGKNLQFLMLSFLLSHIIYLFGIRNSDNLLCFWNSVLMHFFFLSDFSWMSLCLLHLTHSLLSFKTIPHPNPPVNIKTVLLLALTGFGFPALIVTVSVLLDEYGTEYTRVGYADDNICFPRRYPMNLFVFIGPVAISLMINIICLVIVGGIVFQSEKATHNSSTKPYRWYVPLFIRLSIVTGLSWAFGFLAEATGVVAFRYCFIVLGGLQGAMITLSFVFSGRNWQEVKNKLSRSKRHDTWFTVLVLGEIFCLLICMSLN